MLKVCLTILVGLTAVSLGVCNKGVSKNQKPPLKTAIISNVATPKSSSTKSEFLSQAEKDRVLQEKILIAILDEIDREGRIGEAGCSLTSVRLAAHLMNWGVSTTLTPDQVKTATVLWLQPLGQDKQVEFSQKLDLVRDTYKNLLTKNAQQLLDEAGCKNEVILWNNKPIKTVEAVMQAVFGE